MSKVVIGSIPKKISYIYTDEKEAYVGCLWDLDYSADGTIAKEKVTPTFAADSSDSIMVDKFKHWTENSWNSWNTKITKQAHIIEVDNNPINNIRIISLLHGSGYSIYKVLIDNKYYVDLREDVLMETMLKEGVSKNGILNGKYIWANIRSNMRLIRVDSEIYKSILEYESRKDLKTIKKKDLEVGGVYQDKRKNRSIFIGYVDTITFKHADLNNRWNLRRLTTEASFNFNKTKKKKAMLFYFLDVGLSVDQALKKIPTSPEYYFNIKTSHQFIEKIDSVKIISNDIINNLRNRVKTDIKQKIINYTEYKKNPNKTPKFDSFDLECYLEFDSCYLNLYPYKTEIKEFDIKPLLTFS